jgi:hypothetical protein
MTALRQTVDLSAFPDLVVVSARDRLPCGGKAETPAPYTEKRALLDNNRSRPLRRALEEGVGSYGGEVHYGRQIPCGNAHDAASFMQARTARSGRRSNNSLSDLYARRHMSKTQARYFYSTEPHILARPHESARSRSRPSNFSISASFSSQIIR